MFAQDSIVGCECEQIYDVVADVERYPEFLPGWREVHVLHRSGTSMIVEQQLRFGLFTARVRSLAILRRPLSIQVRPLDARATGINLEWSFDACGAQGCHVSLRIFGQSSNHLLASALDAALTHTGELLLELFAARVKMLRGIH